jgi:hypothetical protein
MLRASAIDDLRLVAILTSVSPGSLGVYIMLFTSASPSAVSWSITKLDGGYFYINVPVGIAAILIL